MVAAGDRYYLRLFKYPGFGYSALLPETEIRDRPRPRLWSIAFDLATKCDRVSNYKAVDRFEQDSVKPAEFS
jgi:hypothetical protein